jgi:hypothetical protein
MCGGGLWKDLGSTCESNGLLQHRLLLTCWGWQILIAVVDRGHSEFRDILLG